MAEEPGAKKQRLSEEGSSSKVEEGVNIPTNEALAQLEEVQGELDNINEKASHEIIQIEQKYSQLRAPHLSERQKLVDSVPNFWVTVFMNHPVTSSMLMGEEEECLHYLVRLEVKEDFTDTRSTYSLRFIFDVNPFFENTEIVKEFATESSQETVCKCTTIQWKPGKELTKSHSCMTSSFFEWLTDDSDPNNDDVAEMVKDDIWQNPLQYFLHGQEAGDAESQSDLEDEEDDLEEP